MNAAVATGYAGYGLTPERLEAYLHGMAILLYTTYGYNEPDASFGGMLSHTDWNPVDIMEFIARPILDKYSVTNIQVEGDAGHIGDVIVDMIADFILNWGLIGIFIDPDDPNEFLREYLLSNPILLIERLAHLAHADPPGTIWNKEWPYFFEGVQGFEDAIGLFENDSITTADMRRLRTELAWWELYTEPSFPYPAPCERDFYEGALERAFALAWQYKLSIDQGPDYLDYEMDDISIWHLSRKAGILGGMYPIPNYSYFQQPGIVDMHFEKDGDLVYTDQEIEEEGPAEIVSLPYDIVLFGDTKILVFGDADPVNPLQQEEHPQPLVDDRITNALDVDAQSAVNDGATELSFQVRTKHKSQNIRQTMFNSDYRGPFDPANNHPDIYTNPFYETLFLGGNPRRTSSQNPLDNPKLYWPYTLGITPVLNILNAPANLAATLGTSPFEVDLTWENAWNHAAGFEIWRGTEPEPGNAVKIGEVDVDDGPPYEYPDASANPSTWCFYHVRTFSEGKELFSNFSSSSVFTSTIVSASPEVISYNNARKVVYDRGRLHLVYTYQEQEWEFWQKEVHYRESMDGGRTWSDPLVLDDYGTHPAIAVGPSGDLAVVWQSSSEGGNCLLYYTYRTQSGWRQYPKLLSGTTYSDSMPSIFVDENNIAHVAATDYFDRHPEGPSPEDDWRIVCYEFPVTLPEQEYKHTVTLSEVMNPGWRFPSIAVTASGIPHIVWQEGSKIYHSYHDGIWTNPALISNGTYPCIAAGPGETIYLAFMSPDDVMFGEFDGGWAFELLAFGPYSVADKVLPVVLYQQGTIYVIWNDGMLDPELKDRIYYRRKQTSGPWYPTQEWIGTPYYSVSPHVAFGGPPMTVNRYLYLVWNENAFSAPYYVGSTPKRIGTQISDPLLSINLGTETPTQYTVQREGYMEYGPATYQTIDYHPTELIYEITGLDPNGNYILEFEYYHEFPGVVTQEFFMDTVATAVVMVPPEELVYAEGAIPGAVLQDRAILVEVTKSQGDFAVAGFLTLWEEERTEVPGGPQLARTRNRRTPKDYALSQNAPNPFIDRTTIRYQLPRRSDVSLKTYNVAGQLVQTLVNESQKAGYYEVEWNGNDEHDQRIPNGVYFYRLQAGDFTAGKKLILLR